jgi:hypothetical protein
MMLQSIKRLDFTMVATFDETRQTNLETNPDDEDVELRNPVFMRDCSTPSSQLTTNLTTF